MKNKLRNTKGERYRIVFFAFRSLLFAFLLLSISLSGFSKEQKKWEYSYTYRYMGVREGLGQSQAILSFQDSYGYLWISTYGGISRFDGLLFDNFSLEELGIAGSRVKYFNQYESAVYMLSSRSIVFVYPDRTIECYPLPSSSLLLSMDYITEAAVVGNYLYIFNCQSPDQNNDQFSLLRFDLKTKKFTLVAKDLPYLMSNVFEQTIYAITSGEINNRQLTLYRIDGEQIKAVQNIPVEKSDLVVNFKKTNRNEWFAVLTKGSKFDLTRHIYQCFVESDSIRWNYLGAFYAENWGDFRLERWDDNRLLIGTSTSHYPALILDINKKSLSAFPVSMILVNHILMDKDGNIWFSTEDGIYQCSRFFFESYQLGLGHNDNIYGVIKDSNGNVWFSSYSYGFWRADAQGNLYRLETVCENKDIPIWFAYMSDCVDNRGRVFQTSDEGLAVFDPKQGDLNRLNIIPTGRSLSVYDDEESGNIYFGGESGNHRTLNILHSNGEISSYPSANKYIVSICRDGNRKLRLGLFSSEAWFDEENRKVIIDTVQRPYQGVIAMTVDRNGVLWKGTTQGLYAEDIHGNNRQIFDKKVNLVINYKNRYIIWVVKDNLYIMDLQAYHQNATVRIRTFGLYDGFNLMECVQNGVSIDPEGYVWVTGGDKVIRFLPDQIMGMPLPQATQAPYLAAIYNTDKNSEWSPVRKDSLMEFDNHNNYLRFDILQASLTAPDKLVFRYKLNGYNDQWSNSSSRSFVFQNLPFGKYTLEAQSSFDAGAHWSNSVFSPEITIRKPFLLTVPGLLLIFSGILAMAMLLIYYTRKISIRKQEEIRKIDRMKHKAVQAKFIPHFTGNVLNSINYLISKNPDLAQKYIAKFNDFSKLTLLNSDKLTRTIQEELEYSQLYMELEKLRFQEKLEYCISVASEVDTQKMIPPMILQTFCENAIKHGLRPKPEGGKITINVYPKDDYIVLAVEDTGIGREQAQRNNTSGTKEGLHIVQQQLDLFNKQQVQKAFLQIVDLQDEAGQPSGTLFELHIPER